VLALVICSLIYQWWSTRGGPATAAPPQQTAAREEAVKPAPPPQTEAPSSPVPGAVKPEAVQPEPVKPELASTQPVQLTLTASEETWVSAHADGKYVFSATLGPNETRSVAAESGVRLLVGNAGGLAVTFNGKPVGPLGPRGQVRVVQATPAGVNIQEKKPAAETPPPDIL
jgi:cytoskeleton protein RodZ